MPIFVPHLTQGLLLATISKTPIAQININKFIGAGLVFTGAICFSSKAILVKLAYQHSIDAISLLNLRMIFSLPFFLAVAFYMGGKEKNQSLSGKDFLKLAILGIIGYYISSLLDFKGLQFITAGMERLILFVYPTIVVLITAVYHKTPIRRNHVIALFLTYMGIVIAFIFDVNISGQKDILKGGILIFLCAISYAFYIFGSGKMISKIGTLKFTAYAMTISSFAIILHAFVESGWQFLSFSKEIYFLSFLMAVVATVIPSFLISEGIRRVGSDNASIISSIGPISTILMAYVILNENIGWAQLLGTLFVIFGVLLISLKKS